MEKFNNEPFYQSSKEEIEAIEKEAFESISKELPKFENLDSAKTWIQNTTETGKLKEITLTVYQVERIEAILRGIQRAYEEFLKGQ